jgi:phytanoyl-CoA hydroxylase
MDDNYAAVAAEYNERGFAVVPGFMPQGEVEEALAQLAEFSREVLPRLPPTRAFFTDPSDPASVRMIDFGGAPQAAPEIDHSFFLQMSARPRYQALGRACLGEPIAPVGGDKLSLFNKTAGKSGETPAHQDNHYFCLDPPNCLTIWVTLDVVTRLTGALRYIPYSHKEGVCRPHTASYNLGFSQKLVEYSDSDRASEVVVDQLQPGDAVVHHCQTIHRADQNNASVSSGLQRRAFGVVFRGQSCIVDDVALAEHVQSIVDQGLPGGGAEREKLRTCSSKL